MIQHWQCEHSTGLICTHAFVCRSILQAKQHPHAYINAVETAKPRAVTRSILDQLRVQDRLHISDTFVSSFRRRCTFYTTCKLLAQGKARQLGNSYAAETRCEGLDAFPPALEGQEACVHRKALLYSISVLHNGHGSSRMPADLRV